MIEKTAARRDWLMQRRMLLCYCCCLGGIWGECLLARALECFRFLQVFFHESREQNLTNIQYIRYSTVYYLCDTPSLPSASWPTRAKDSKTRLGQGFGLGQYWPSEWILGQFLVCFLRIAVDWTKLRPYVANVPEMKPKNPSMRAYTKRS